MRSPFFQCLSAWIFRPLGNSPPALSALFRSKNLLMRAPSPLICPLHTSAPFFFPFWPPGGTSWVNFSPFCNSRPPVSPKNTADCCVNPASNGVSRPELSPPSPHPPFFNTYEFVCVLVFMAGSVYFFRSLAPLFPPSPIVFLLSSSLTMVSDSPDSSHTNAFVPSCVSPFSPRAMYPPPVGGFALVSTPPPPHSIRCLFSFFTFLPSCSILEAH